MTREEKINAQREEITRIFDYFKGNQLDTSNQQVMSMIQDAITRVFQLEVEEMGYTFDPNGSNNTFKLTIENSKDISKRGANRNTRNIKDGELVVSTPHIMYNLAALCNGLESGDEATRLTTCKNMFKTVFHEIQHHRQELMTATTVSSKESMMYARDSALHKYLDKSFYSRDGVTGNYTEFSTENNANEVGYRQLLETLGIRDEETSRLGDIESGRFNTNRYKAKVTSFDGKSYFDSDGLQERSDVAVPILDKLIGERGMTDILKLYPILQKEFNMDGTKKTAVDLIRSMQSEVSDISQMQDISDKDRRKLTRDSQEMYYELIYNALEKSTPEQIQQLASQIGKDECKELFDRMGLYFQTELENRTGKSARMAAAQEKLGAFIEPSNNGTIMVEENGKKRFLTVEQFIDTIDEEMLKKTFKVPGKGEVSAEDFIKKNCFKYLAQDGKMTLKDGTTLTAKQYVEQYMLQMGELRQDYPPSRLVEDTVQSQDPWKIHQQTQERLITYYEDKKHFIADVGDMVASDRTQSTPVEEKKSPVKPTPEQIASNMQWVKNFMKAYDLTESKTSYDYRAIYEDDNTLQVLQGIKDGHFEGKGLSAIDLDYFPNDREFNIERAIPKLARLLKVADNITIDGGENYLEQFASIPNINEIIEEMKNSKGVQEMFAQAQENLKTGNVPNHKKTRAEVDKKYAQAYLRSGNLTKGSVEEELEYRADSIRGAEMLAVDFDAKSIADISLDRKQKTSLTRVIARQQGKVPSEVIQQNGGYVIVIDTQKQKTQNIEAQEAADSTEWISPTDITDSTLRAGTGKQEINSVVQDIRTSQTRVADKSYEK